jgi:phage-related protein
MGELGARARALDLMSELTYHDHAAARDKLLVWLYGEVKTPPFTRAARLEAGFLLRRLQRGERLEMPHSRPMPTVGARCHELRIVDAAATWRIIYRADRDAVVIVEVFAKKTAHTPRTVIDKCIRRLREYDHA